MNDAQVFHYLGIFMLCIASYYLGYGRGVRVGRKLGMEHGRKVGAYWEQQRWLDINQPAPEIIPNPAPPNLRESDK
jgi:hypothetical protein